MKFNTIIRRITKGIKLIKTKEKNRCTVCLRTKDEAIIHQVEQKKPCDKNDCQFKDAIERAILESKEPKFIEFSVNKTNAFDNELISIKWNILHAKNCYIDDIGDVDCKGDYDVVLHETMDIKFNAQSYKGDIFSKSIHIKIFPTIWRKLNNYISNNYMNKIIIKNILKSWIKLIYDLNSLNLGLRNIHPDNMTIKKDGCISISDNPFSKKDYRPKKIKYTSLYSNQNEKSKTELFKVKDQFSHIVILIVLKSLIFTPKLWNQNNNGTNILFSNSDFTNPNESVLLKKLTTSDQLDVRILSSILKTICLLSYSEIKQICNFNLDKAKISAQIKNLKNNTVRLKKNLIKVKQCELELLKLLININ